MGSVNHFLYQKFVLFACNFWVSVSTYLLPLFGFIRTNLLRFKGNKSSLENNTTCSVLPSEENYKKDLNGNALVPESEVKQEYLTSFKETETDEVGEKETDEVGEKETPLLSFRFKFPTFEEFSKSKGGNNDFLTSESLSAKCFGRFIEEQELMSLNVEEKVNNDTSSGASGNDEVFEDGFLSDYDFRQVISESEGVRDEIVEELVDSECFEEVVREKIEATTFAEENPHLDDSEGDLNDDLDEVDSEKDSISTKSDSGSMNLSRMHSIMSHLIDSYSDDEFLSDGDFGGEFEVNSSLYDESDECDDEDSDIMEELGKLEEEVDLQTSETFDSKFVTDKDFHEGLNKFKDEEFIANDYKLVNGSDNSEKLESNNSSVMGSEETNELETLWEHQDLIEQLKIELRKVRATGLPTILEESESPNIDDLKPWKIDDKFHHEDYMGELHKFYKSYRERMRKLDILNYQKMYAIGFLQLKDPLQSITSQKKSSIPALTSLLSQSKRKRVESDHMVKFISELQSDLEVVYVGQMCLSWEILHWQYEKAFDLWESDPRGIHRYNDAAGEFQQFQVLLQRFIEDEAFQGPRVQNYVKNRCLLRNLLQIPLIREDSSKDRKKARMQEKGEYAITSDMLVEMMEESIRIFWRFVRADKDCSNPIVKGRRGPCVQLQDPEDFELLLEVRRNLQKKERKLKDLLRSGNCILRRFQKCREDNSDQVLYFFSQVDMKLVSRVLNTSKITTDQLVWCRNKLGKISFIKSKIHVEPSFLLFPC